MGTHACSPHAAFHDGAAHVIDTGLHVEQLSGTFMRAGSVLPFESLQSRKIRKPYLSPFSIILRSCARRPANWHDFLQLQSAVECTPVEALARERAPGTHRAYFL